MCWDESDNRQKKQPRSFYERGCVRLDKTAYIRPASVSFFRMAEARYT